MITLFDRDSNTFTVPPNATVWRVAWDHTSHRYKPEAILARNADKWGDVYTLTESAAWGLAADGNAYETDQLNPDWHDECVAVDPWA